MTSVWRSAPGWGEAHLTLDAIVAYVDDELSALARRRADSHLAHCAECAAEVVVQTQARLALRGASAPTLPSALLKSLRSIPDDAELPEPPAGLAVGPDGQLVSVLRPAGPRRPPSRRRAKFGAGAVVSGLALGAAVVAGTSAGETSSGPTGTTTPVGIEPGAVRAEFDLGPRPGGFGPGPNLNTGMGTGAGMEPPTAAEMRISPPAVPVRGDPGSFR